ncbi:MICAL-like protein 1 isoform X2 [Anoplopoma fimbria]|uniref:MICAL-like protein 1 isoform X2 n=1 Tax=Anoplopoma fimbria TaxID=229290 RepID=UPI0023EB014F|nr:MICAL-like protein 1 isoform X2 [Anoplopoma fimbria]
MASPKAVQDWCRVSCAKYPNVEIKNMSTSFRDGLAFCAIIHSHRPDLIDFCSLCKDNVYQNNKMAFDIAERKLGIPALLDPKDMVSTEVPDCLSVITYLSQYYYFFKRKSYAGLASSRPSQVTSLNNLKKSKTPDGLKRLKSQSVLETSREDRLSNTRLRTVCHLCFKPVHLIQRHLTDGKVYHRSCFRCKVCHSTLLPESYTQGSDNSSLICTHHITGSTSTSVDLNQQIRSTDNQPKCKFQAGYFSLGGLPISSVPHYTKTTEPQDRQVCKTPETEGREIQERSTELKDRDSTVGPKCTTKKPAPPRLPPPSVEGRAVKRAGKAGLAPVLVDSKIQQEETKSQRPSELSSPCARVTEGSSRPVPTPRRLLDPSAVPVPAPRTKAAQPMDTSTTAGHSCNQNKCSTDSSHIPTRNSPKVHTNHPWMTIIHPGPWTQLPPAPPPVPAPRSKSVSNMQSWNRPRVLPPNPFGEEVDDDTQKEDTKPEPADQTDLAAGGIRSGNGGNQKNTAGDTDAVGCSSDAEDSAIISTADDVGASCEPAGETSKISSDLDETGNTKSLLPDVTEAAAEEAQSHILPRSLSVPAITSARSQSSLLDFDSTEANESDQVPSCQNKLACKENPFDRKPAMPKSKTFQALPSTRTPAPGHGFPLIKRKVQTDQNVNTEDLEVEKRELEKHLEALEQRGVEMEGNLRDNKNDEDEEQMLMEWFSLINERHVLMRRETELVHLTKQQKLEERQADVEYEIRCLLNKPMSDWSQEDRGQEQQLMDELVTIIEQRNQIVSSLDRDRLRESEEDMLLEAMMKNKEFQKEGLKELKKSKGKFKPTKMFKMLNHKAESNKDSMDKKN